MDHLLDPVNYVLIRRTVDRFTVKGIEVLGLIQDMVPDRIDVDQSSINVYDESFGSVQRFVAFRENTA